MPNDLIRESIRECQRSGGVLPERAEAYPLGLRAAVWAVAALTAGGDPTAPAIAFCEARRFDAQ
jgi:hypothetical protein